MQYIVIASPRHKKLPAVAGGIHPRLCKFANCQISYFTCSMGNIMLLDYQMVTR